MFSIPFGMNFPISVFTVGAEIREYCKHNRKDSLNMGGIFYY